MGDVLLALLRAAHGLTAAVWLGLALVGVWNPALLNAARGAGGWSPRAVAQTSLWALVITGAVLMLDRLADPSGASSLYVGLLGVKLACVAAMGLLGLVPPAAEPAAGAASRRAWLTRGRRERLLLGLGLAAFVLGSLLTSAYEAAARAGYPDAGGGAAGGALTRGAAWPIPRPGRRPLGYTGAASYGQMGTGAVSGAVARDGN